MDRRCEVCDGEVKDDEEGHVRVCVGCGRVDSSGTTQLGECAGFWSPDGQFVPAEWTSAPAAVIGGRHAPRGVLSGNGVPCKTLKRTEWLVSAMALGSQVNFEAQRLARCIGKSWKGSANVGAAVCVYCAARQHNPSIAVEDVAKASNVPAGKILRTSRRLKPLLGVETKPPSVDELARRYLTVLRERLEDGLDLQPPPEVEVLWMLDKVLLVAKNMSLLEGRDPKSVSAAIAVFSLRAVLKSPSVSPQQLLGLLQGGLRSAAGARCRYNELCDRLIHMCKSEIPWADTVTRDNVFSFMEDLFELLDTAPSGTRSEPPPAYLASREQEKLWEKRVESARRRLEGRASSTKAKIDQLDIRIEEDLLRGIKPLHSRRDRSRIGKKQAREQNNQQPAIPKPTPK
uniref:TFIIB-type domain-containing protein n=1 Tax=Rhodosorus marinus TaxID=101924 RepID=A0A7S3EPA6_9RHOD|mmetsp:Transcript_6471/g.27538  ORF Transcript_6471/g.27538 Transcript_6471/m.27538 type:complete len:401 (+) Transcript_6471:357-1559(+)